MGRGSSGAKTGNSVTRLIGTDNKPIDLPAPLTYGNDDQQLTGSARSSVEEFEKKRASNKIEYMRFVDPNGRIIEEDKGSAHHVRGSVYAAKHSYAMTHNHPRTNGMLGGTFSQADINNFSNQPMIVNRAAAPEGTYSISKTQAFDGNGLKTYFQKARTSAWNNYEQEFKDATAKYTAVSEAYGRKEASYATLNKAYESMQTEKRQPLINF
ncbi:MAG: hypothetical protein IKU30_00700 [Clostridia bacterium]|nr:hypothetical protein [Clostridia bacterium]